jgi:hypothetical protein
MCKYELLIYLFVVGPNDIDFGSFKYATPLDSTEGRFACHDGRMSRGAGRDASRARRNCPNSSKVVLALN